MLTGWDPAPCLYNLPMMGQRFSRCVPGKVPAPAASHETRNLLSGFQPCGACRLREAASRGARTSPVSLAHESCLFFQEMGHSADVFAGSEDHEDFSYGVSQVSASQGGLVPSRDCMQVCGVGAIWIYLIAMKHVHSETCSLLFELYTRDQAEKNGLFNAMLHSLRTQVQLCCDLFVNHHPGEPLHHMPCCLLRVVGRLTLFSSSGTHATQQRGMASSTPRFTRCLRRPRLQSTR